VGGFASHLLAWFIRLGAFGLLTFGFLDSLILVFPFGNDVLLILLVARKRDWFPIYAACATLGSIAGTLVLDLLTRKGGEEGLKKMMKAQRFSTLKKRLGERAGVALAVASMAPPPFPFTPVIAAASAFQYPRRRLLSIVAAMRTLRFFVLGMAAYWTGREVLRIMQASWFKWAVAVIVVFGIIASAIAVIRFFRRR